MGPKPPPEPPSLGRLPALRVKLPAAGMLPPATSMLPEARGLPAGKGTLPCPAPPLPGLCACWPRSHWPASELLGVLPLLRLAELPTGIERLKGELLALPPEEEPPAASSARAPSA